MDRYYIGLAVTMHDPAIAIINPEGKIVFAEACERILQQKRAWNVQPDILYWIPDLIERYCEPKAEFVVATTWSRSFHAFLLLKYLLSSSCPEWLLAAWRKRPTSLHQYWSLQRWLARQLFRSLTVAGSNFVYRLHNDFGNDRVRVRHYPHHLTHAATACYTSPFSDGECMIADGYGEFGSVSYVHYRNGRIEREKRCLGFATLGYLYIAITELCGFDAFKGEEWKVMGLAPFGKLDKEAYVLLRSIYQTDGCKLKFGLSHRTIAALLSKARVPPATPIAAADLAYTGQRVFAELMENLITSFHATGISDKLIFGGGCALNSSFNGTILDKTPFTQLHVPPAPADDGNAIGAALLAYYQDNPEKKHEPEFFSPYLGSTMSAKTLERACQFLPEKNLRYLGDSVHLETARLLAEGKLVGWVQGRAEFGPRALGNRSILADPRSLETKDAISTRVKFREQFRPYAPSILHEFGDRYFENYQDSPYMERTLRWRPEVRKQVPAVVHVDYTGRVQSVTRERNEKYYELIKAFYQLTNVPVLLNTSFNLVDKPIIHSVEDAIGSFYSTGLDALVIGDYLLLKEPERG